MSNSPSIAMLQPTQTLPSNAPMESLPSNVPVKVLSSNATIETFAPITSSGRCSFETTMRYGSTPKFRHIDSRDVGNYLFHRFQSSHQWVRYRKRANEKPVKEQKWPDYVEEAFFKALARWIPTGKRKIYYNGKPHGRNELISEYIKELTGEVRDRKQISSHIQTLKPFVKGDPFIMRYLTYQRDAFIDCETLALTSRRPRACSAIVIDRDALDSAWQKVDFFKPTDFEMFIQQTSNGKVERLHTYTSTVTSTTDFPPDQPCSWQSLHDQYPLLVPMANQTFGCNVFLAEASIVLPERSSYTPDTELSIVFFCNSTLPPRTRVICRNSFYHDEQRLDVHNTRPFEATLDLAEGGGSETQLKFGSTFWAKILTQLTARYPGNRDEVAAYLDSLTACQEVVTRTNQGYERVAIVYWNFRLSSHLQGSTTWRRLLLPPSGTEMSEANTHATSAASAAAVATAAEPLYGAAYPILQSPFHYSPPNTACTFQSNSTWAPDDSSIESNAASSLTSVDAGAAYAPEVDASGDLKIQLSYEPVQCCDYDANSLSYGCPRPGPSAPLAIHEDPTQLAGDAMLQGSDFAWNHSLVNLVPNIYGPPYALSAGASANTHSTDHDHDQEQAAAYAGTARDATVLAADAKGHNVPHLLQELAGMHSDYNGGKGYGQIGLEMQGNAVDVELFSTPAELHTEIEAMKRSTQTHEAAVLSGMYIFDH